ncbi:MAG: HigA family addiction module antitoxin [bacterium]
MDERNINQYIPDSVSPPGDTLLETIEAMDMSQAQLAERTGRPQKTISEIINAKTRITSETALQLERVLGVPAHFWMNRERLYQEALARQEERERLKKDLAWLKKIPVRAMVKKGWIRSCEDKVNQLREVLNFFGVAAPEQWDKIWNSQAAAYRQSQAFRSNPTAVAAWMRRGELEAQAIECKPYEASKFEEALKQIRALTSERAESFQPEVVELCAKAGVAVVFVPELPKTRLYGATRWLSSNKALMQLSLRRKYNDEFWFTFFHESFHLLSHGKRGVFIEAEGPEDPTEKEADDFAANCLIPKKIWEYFVSRGNYGRNAVCKFAAQINVAPGIVVGRLQHEKLIPFNQLNKLKVRFEWAEGNGAD